MQGGCTLRGARAATRPCERNNQMLTPLPHHTGVPGLFGRAHWAAPPTGIPSPSMPCPALPRPPRCPLQRMLAETGRSAHLLAPAVGSLISAAHLPHGRCRTPL